MRGWWGAAGVSMSYKITLQSSYLDTDTFHPTATRASLVRARPFSVVREWGFQPDQRNYVNTRDVMALSHGNVNAKVRGHHVTLYAGAVLYITHL